MFNPTLDGREPTSAPNFSVVAQSQSSTQKRRPTPTVWQIVLNTLPHDWSLTPVKDKRPLRPDWQTEPPLPHQQLLPLLNYGQKLQNSNGNYWHCHWTGIGLRTGTLSSGLIALDVDGELAEAKLQELSKGDLPLTVSWTSGKLGRRQLLYRLEPELWDSIKSHKLDCGNGEHLEFRWDGMQSVLPPSRHPETGHYQWLVSPSCAPVADAPQWLINFLLGQSPFPTAPAFTSLHTPSPATAQQWTDIDWARSYLHALSPARADDYDQWVQVGMALHSVADELLRDWDSWSQQSAKYQPGDCQRKWRSFSQKAGGLSIGSLAQWAKEDGWQSPFKYQENSPSPDSPSPHTSPKEQPSTKKSQPDNPPSGGTLPIREAVARARQILTANYSEIEQNTLLEELRSQTDLNRPDWEHRFLKPLKKELRSLRLKLEVAAYLAESDPFERLRRKGEICSTYRLSGHDLNFLANILEQQQQTPLQQVFSFEEFLNQNTEALRWIIPGLLPAGETVLLAALAKTGKTLLVTDIMHAVLSGGQVLGESVGVKGKVLLITSDESHNSTRRRLRARGFDLLPERHNLRIMTHLDIRNLTPLEQQLEDFRPTLVVIDSLTSITEALGISEKDADFARHVYKLKDLLGRYGSAGLLIHHENKDKEAKGLNKISGSARIPAAVWGTWQILAANPDNEQDLTRWLKVKPREGEAITLNLSLHPKDLWASQGIFEFIGEFGDENGEKKSQGERVLALLAQYSPKGLEYQEIDRLLNMGRSLYTVLDRLEDRQLISKRRSELDKRRLVYTALVESASQQTEEIKVNIIPPPLAAPPPPSNLSTEGQFPTGCIDISAVEDSQQIVNTQSTNSQHRQDVDETVNGLSREPVKDSHLGQLSQQRLDNGGGEVNQHLVEQKVAGEPYCSETAVVDNNLVTYDWKEIIASIDDEMARLGWTVQQGQDYLLANYGKRARFLLDDEELLEFWSELKSLPSPKFSAGTITNSN